MSYAEIHPRIFERVGEHEYRGKRRWLVTPSGAKSLAGSVYDTTHPDGYGTWAPKCYRYQIVKNFEPDAALVVAFYKTLRKPGYATVELRTWHDYEKRQTDLSDDEKTIEGPDRDATHTQHYEWRVTDGSNRVPVPRCKVIVKTASDTFNPDTVIDRVGCVNNKNLSNFGNIGRKGALLLLGAPQTRYWPEGNLWYINYAFAYSGPNELWNEQCKSRRGLWVAGEMVTVNTAGNVLTSYVPHATRRFMYKQYVKNLDDNGNLINVTLEDADPEESRILFEEADFSDLDGYMEWIVST